MRRKADLPELLAPAGDFECLVAAVKGGADAIYIGGKMFSARAYAKNFDIDEIERAVAYCHLHGVKLYVTMNILVYDSEIEWAIAFAKDLYRVGVDALIIADLGLVSAIREEIPDFELHASTQMSVNNSVGADLAYDLGCTRVVLARELSGKNMKDVTEKCKAETEVFLHGALCVCHSGQCLFSSMIGGRSGNRGECAQPCRLPYNNGKYILSLSDLSLAEHIKELIDSGVASLKIEGRMKSPDYVYTVTSIYRRLLDENRNSTRKENEKLERAFSRGGFTDGYFTGDTFRKMTGVRTEEDKRISESEEKGDFTYERTRVKAKVLMRLGEPAKMTLTGVGIDREVTVFGGVPDVARNAPLSVDAVKDRLAKMGNTLLSLSPDDIDLTLDDGINLSPSLINQLRRDAAERFEDFTRDFEAAEKIEAKKYRGGKTNGEIGRTAIFFNPDSLLRLDEYSRSYFDAIFVPLSTYPDCNGVANGVYIPPVIMEDELTRVKKMLQEAAQLGAKYALIGNLSHMALAKEAGLVGIGDFRLNVTNQLALEAWHNIGLDDVTVSPELTARQSRDVGGRAIVYGRIPLMLTERCFMKENFGCEQCGKCTLIDRKGVKFPMMRDFEHRNLIFNSAFTYMGDKQGELSGISAHHFIFTTERADEIKTVVDAFKSSRPFPLNGQFRRMGKRSV